MGKGLVYTTLFGGRSKIIPVTIKEKDVDYVMFTDEKPKDGKGWTIQPCPSDKDGRHRYQSRRWKWPVCDDYDWTVYIDSTHSVEVAIREHVEGVWLKNHDIAVFKHPIRDCVYDEIEACRTRRKARKSELDDTKKYLEAKGFEKHAGLAALGIIARRPTEKQRDLAEDMLKDLERYCSRDQLFFNYHADRLDIQYHEIQGGTVYNSRFFRYHGPHAYALEAARKQK